MITQSFMNNLQTQMSSTFGTAKKYEGDKTRLNLRLPLETKKEFERLAKDNGISVTKLIMCAVEVLKEDLKNKSVEISPIGIKIK